MLNSDDRSLSIVYQDAQYIAINKPSGLLVHRTGIDAQETRFAMQLLRDQIGQRVYPIHRIDKPTSGILLFALSEKGLVKIERQFVENQVTKRYLAIVRGHAPGSGEINRPLRKMIDFGSQAKSEKEQEARTRFCRLSKTELPVASGPYPTTRYSYLELEPQTGRRHQLRRHLAGINCPIIGDTKHGDTHRNQAFFDSYSYLRLFLHVSQLSFDHPLTGKRIEIKAPLWPDFRNALQATGLTRSESGSLITET